MLNRTVHIEQYSCSQYQWLFEFDRSYDAITSVLLRIPLPNSWSVVNVTDQDFFSAWFYGPSLKRTSHREARFQFKQTFESSGPYSEIRHA